MPQFKVGDKVCINSDGVEEIPNFEHIGEIGVVDAIIDNTLVIVNFNDEYAYAMWVVHLEKVEEQSE